MPLSGDPERDERSHMLQGSIHLPRSGMHRGTWIQSLRKSHRFACLSYVALLRALYTRLRASRKLLFARPRNPASLAYLRIFSLLQKVCVKSVCQALTFIRLVENRERHRPSQRSHDRYSVGMRHLGPPIPMLRKNRRTRPPLPELRA